MDNRSVTIIDYGAGNILSVRRSLELFNANVIVTSKPKEVSSAERLILPGVGAFPAAMRSLCELDLVGAIQDFASSGRPMLAICLGMQLLMETSTEQAETQGLGIVQGRAIRIPENHDGKERKVPHIGWNSISPVSTGLRWDRSLLRKTPINAEMYFVHSYVVEPENLADELATSVIDGFTFCSGISKGNVTGFQFHPEKSSTFGLEIMKQFLELK